MLNIHLYYIYKYNNFNILCVILYVKIIFYLILYVILYIMCLTLFNNASHLLDININSSMTSNLLSAGGIIRDDCGNSIVTFSSQPDLHIRNLEVV